MAAVLQLTELTDFRCPYCNDCVDGGKYPVRDGYVPDVCLFDKCVKCGSSVQLCVVAGPLADVLIHCFDMGK